VRTWFEPSPPLREFVRGYLYERPGGLQRPIVPVLETRLAFFPGAPCRVFDHRVHKVEALSRAVVIGPQTRRWVDLQPTPRFWSLLAVFQPGAFHRLFGHDTSTLADYAHPAGDVVGRRVNEVLERVEAATSPREMALVVDGYLLAHVPGARAQHPVDRAAHALAAAHGAIRAWTLAERSGLGDRYFRRRFIEHVGMSPKHYAKVARFGFALSLKTERPAQTWAAISQQAGYFDQMHLVKDFKALTESPPSTLFNLLAPSLVD
jgi:AraC-like DNA-binding protein